MLCVIERKKPGDLTPSNKNDAIFNSLEGPQFWILNAWYDYRRIEVLIFLWVFSVVFFFTDRFEYD